MESLVDFMSAANVVEFVTYATFLVGFLGMAAGVVFFGMERGSVPVRYREAMTTTAVILFIAAVNYFFMQGLYVRGILQGEEVFPTAFRYVDWLLTTPLMLIKFPLLLGMGPRGRTFLMQLVALDLVMILTGFAGELSLGNNALHFGLFAVGAIAWVGILYLLLNAVRVLPDSIDGNLKGAVRVMAKFVLFGWIIYPVGYLLPSIAMAGEGLTWLVDARELVYNIGDVINKVGLGMVVYIFAIKTRAAAREA